MMDANHISERLGSMRREISDLRVTTARYWSKDQHTALEKSASPYERDVCWRSNGSVGHDETLCLNPGWFRQLYVR